MQNTNNNGASRRAAHRTTFLLPLLALVTSLPGRAQEAFETPVDEPPAASLSAAQISGKYFHIEDPVHSDGLMHRYVIESRFGELSAYGVDALNVRLRELAALTTITDMSDENVAFKAVGRGIQDQVKMVARTTTHPIDTLVGVPTGIAHLLGGYRAQAQEITTQAKQQLTSTHTSAAGDSQSSTVAKVGSQATHLAKSQADHYFGLSAAERRWYTKLNVDPYTNNQVLRKAVTHLARIDAAASFGMRFAPVGIPFAGEMQQALNAIDHEDPAVLRKRRHEMLAAQGLSEAQIERFEHTPYLTPTRQTILVDATAALSGVDGRVELLRHAMTVEYEDEIEVFLQSTLSLLRFHAHQPVHRILAGPRIPTAELADGHVVVFGAFDAVQWTEQVAGYERVLREALPPTAGREVWATGAVSTAARSALEQRGWIVHVSSTGAASTSP